MEFDCPADALFHLIDRIANRHTARQVRDVCSVILLAFFDNDDVLHIYLLFLQAGLLENAIRRALWHVFPRMTTDCDASLFRRMSVLAMVTLSTDMKPAILLDHLDNVSNFHGAMILYVS